MIQDEELRALILALCGENEKLRQEAIIHAQEARTQRATVHECYEAVTGKTGEPADWNGAQPVRECITALRSRVADLEKALDEIDTVSSHAKYPAQAECERCGEIARSALTPDSRAAMRKGEKA